MIAAAFPGFVVRSKYLDAINLIKQQKMWRYLATPCVMMLPIVADKLSPCPFSTSYKRVNIMNDNERNRHYLVQEMIHRYLQRAWSDSELAEALGTDRTNVYKIRTKVLGEQMGIVLEPVERSRYRIDPRTFIAHIPLSPTEALALYLGGRRLQQQTRTGQQAIATALEKLAQALRKPLTVNLVRAAQVVLEQEQDLQQANVMRVLMEAWLNGRRVRIQHRKLHGELRSYVVSPYQIEPAVWGDGLYLIGYSDYHNELATFKITRIEHATQTTEPYNIPDDFDSHTLLQHAWGIWHADEKPITVRLRFTRHVTPRVKESIWHPSQTIQDLDDGGCIWQAEIAEIQEIIPWVRGWGADCTVLEPLDLREESIKTATKLSQTYGLTLPITRLPYQIPYAKTKPGTDEVHLLLYHLIDVGQVALCLWQEVLTEGIRIHLAQLLGLSTEEAGRWFAFLVSLHDLGKAGPAYQNKYAPDSLKKELRKAGLVLDDPMYHPDTARKAPHGTVSTWALTKLLPDMLQIDKRFAQKIAVAVGGHHGTWPGSESTDFLDDSRHPQWDVIRHDLVWELKAVFSPPVSISVPESQMELNALLTILSGLTSVADWVGSRNEECFGFVGEPMSTRQYADRAAEKAVKSLADLGWRGWQPSGNAQPFAQTFAYLNFREPHPVQQRVIDLAQHLELPTLLILEAPTGMGKTETALYLADTWLQQQRGRGLYVAMPTQATSNQMFDRVKEFLGQRYPDELVNLHLLHGQASWTDRLKEIELQTVGEDAAAGVAALTWFKPRKRTLLAPFGVGTVDQTLLSILQTNHFFVRLFGLSHKVIIFDEVHAYDTYMNTLFHRLLEWLRAIGTSVIILSATLPDKTRRELIKAYTGQTITESTSAYPALTLANAQQQETIALPVPSAHTVHLNWGVNQDPEAIVSFLKQQLTHGGCVAVICNTVRRAQDIYCALKAAHLDILEDNLILFHARFPPIWRQQIEQKVLDKFGKNGQRPHKAIVVATQVIEQSLDLDFDLMISDLAPVDLLIQRAGRLHRHRREERYGHTRRFVIVQPEQSENGLPELPRQKYVYDPYILLRSYLALHQRSHIEIPTDTVALIETVYGNPVDETLTPEWQTALSQAKRKLTDSERKAKSKATPYLVLRPGNQGLLYQGTLDLDEENPETHETFRAQTRDIGLSITLICLFKTADKLAVYDGNQMIPIDLEVEPRSEQIKLLLQNAVSVQHMGIVPFLVAQRPPMVWQTNATLKYCRHVIFENTVCDMPDLAYYLQLDQEYGLQIIKKEAV